MAQRQAFGLLCVPHPRLHTTLHRAAQGGRTGRWRFETDRITRVKLGDLREGTHIPSMSVAGAGDTGDTTTPRCRLHSVFVRRNVVPIFVGECIARPTTDKQLPGRAPALHHGSRKFLQGCT